MTLNQKQFERLAKALLIKGRLGEIDRLEGRVPSSLIAERKRTLKKQLAKLADNEEEVNEVHVRIEIPEGKSEPKEKSYKFSLKGLLGKPNKNEDYDDEDENNVILSSFFPDEIRFSNAKIVKEL